MRRIALMATTAMLAMVGSPQAKTDKPVTVRIGYMPNVTHAQALVGFAEGLFQTALGADGVVKPFVFNAGPSVIEALFAGQLDLAYIGPNPAVNGYVKSHGTALRIIAGAASGGAALVVQPGGTVQRPEDLAGKRVATPQLGNTQDVALRYYLLQHGLATKERGGRVEVIPMQNADILTAFVTRAVDGAWMPEPWVSRLVHETGAAVLVDERDLWPNRRFATTVLIASTKVLREHPELVQRWLAAHVETTRWIQQHPAEAQEIINTQLESLTGKRLPVRVLADAWSRLEITAEPLTDQLLAAADHAFALGFLGQQKPDLAALYDLTLLREVLRQQPAAPSPVAVAPAH